MVLRQYKLTTFGETKRLLSLDETLFDRLLFSEKLYVFNEEGKRVGRFSVGVQTTEIQKCRALVVHISNFGYFNGKRSESTVLGFLTPNLKTLEEIRHETSEVGDGNHDRRFYLLRERTNYYYSITESVCEVVNKRQKTIPFAKTIGLVGEAANIILMRSIAARGYQGILCLKTILSNGKKCKNYYVSKLGKRSVNGVKTEVMIIYRSVTDHEKYSVTMTCAFTRAGQMIYLFWSNSNHFVHVDPDLEVYGQMVDEMKQVGLHRHWNRDKQIFSYYQDMKTAVHADVRTYRHSVEDVRRLMSDWLEFMLCVKPNDVLCSTIDYFTDGYGFKMAKKCTQKAKNEDGDSWELFYSGYT